MREFAFWASSVDEHLHRIPLKFILGFFVTIVVDRWKHIFSNIGFIDKACLYINAYVRDDPNKQDPSETRRIRRTLARWLCLCQVLVLRDASMRIKRRFPTMQSLVESGFMQEQEREMLEEIDFEHMPDWTRQSNSCRYWMPINWVFITCYRLKAQTIIGSDTLLNAILLEVRHYKDGLQKLCNYDWVDQLRSRP